ncbi:MAG TPA: aminopeptidase N [Bacteriovoracaceae bacterium]|nr:aminopeptidase N [Bacteriovoracaceae bacterium]
MEPKTIYLKDYRPSNFQIESVDLSVDIYHDHCLVTSVLKIFKRPELQGQKLNLELNGEGMTLQSLGLDGKSLSPNEYQLSDDKLLVLNLAQDEFTLQVRNRINPAENTALEGFYKSGAQLCTQCEPEGFRKITYFIDRPDVMSKFKTRMTADKKEYPFLLSNGNRLDSGELPGGRHFVEWLDPFKKPSYLFAMVAGDFDVARDSYTTRSGRKVALEIFVDKGNLTKTPHAITSLKTAMKWDEDTFGLEYDLDNYMIVAVDSFNMGAMENKGLNIFNSTYTLADEQSATDHDFQGIQGVIGHEYFHNWTGNRVTCRDWFQLTLKEGLTVFRDQEFSSDMLSRAVKRLEDVRLLKDAQFSEDAGPMSHPIRPSSYIEINNFYTRTVYEKGSEVIRMIHTLIGPELFRKGMDKYFQLYDGQAVTTEDFVHAMEDASGKDLSQFKNWYSRSGTPKLVIRSRRSGEDLQLEIEQQYPPTTFKDAEGLVLHMPFKVGFVGEEQEERLLELTQMKQSFDFKGKAQALVSLNRGFSAPVRVDYPYTFTELTRLMSLDSDPYCRYEATQKVYDHVFRLIFDAYKLTGTLSASLDREFIAAFRALLDDSKIDLSFKSYLLDLPTQNGYAQEMPLPDFDAIHLVHGHLKRKLGVEFQDWFLEQHSILSAVSTFELTPKAFGERALKNQCLSYLVSSGTAEGLAALEGHYNNATNMTEEVFGLQQFISTGVELNHPAVVKFYQKWKYDSLVMLKWFGSLSSYSPKERMVETLLTLERDHLFQNQVPNFLRALYLQFAKNNLVSFHALDGSGYEFVSERIILIDSFNPQVASRAASAFSLIPRVDAKRKVHMKNALQRIMERSPSRDTYEVVSKYLAQ